MKAEDVAQDNDPGYQGFHKMRYGSDSQGKYIAVASSGWCVERDATHVARECLDKKLEQVYAEVKAGRLSPLA